LDPLPRDVDVFVGTDPGIDPRPIQEECLRIGGRLRVAIDATVLPVDESAELVREYLNGPTVEIHQEGRTHA
jgi:hypothetical protein